MRPEVLGKWIKIMDLIGSRTRDLPVIYIYIYIYKASKEGLHMTDVHIETHMPLFEALQEKYTRENSTCTIITRNIPVQQTEAVKNIIYIHINIDPNRLLSWIHVWIGFMARHDKCRKFFFRIVLRDLGRHLHPSVSRKFCKIPDARAGLTTQGLPVTYRRRVYVPQDERHVCQVAWFYDIIITIIIITTIICCVCNWPCSCWLSTKIKFELLLLLLLLIRMRSISCNIVRCNSNLYIYIYIYILHFCSRL
jgi:hypothetical protein